MWDLRWKEHLTPVNFTLQMVLPFCQDLSTALNEEGANGDAPPPEVWEETKRSFIKSCRAYSRTTIRQGACIAVGCLLMLRDSGVPAHHDSLSRNLVYYWDNLGCQLPIYFNAVLIRSVGLPESLAKLMGTCPEQEHVDFYRSCAQSMVGAAQLSFKQSLIPTVADLVIESVAITVRHQRQHKRFVSELLRLVVDKGVLIALQCLLAALGSRVHPLFGTYWVELVGALLLKGVVSISVQRAIGLPPAEPKGPKPLTEGRSRKLW
eukprot:GGOE01054907.1.p1 GENE.GGOE01054907.1~~GGOE01054907.1.p1  ORF type:complete len:304 (-),score=105.19 GGOE01054907.1:122-913(-)